MMTVKIIGAIMTIPFIILLWYFLPRMVKEAKLMAQGKSPDVIPIRIDEYQFAKLVKGEVVEIRTQFSTVRIMLADIGYSNMIGTILEAERKGGRG